MDAVEDPGVALVVAVGDEQAAALEERSERLEEDYNVLASRIRVPAWEKLWILLRSRFAR